MSTFFDSFGVNAVSLIFYLLLFGLVLTLLSRFAFKPVLRAIEDRQRKIDESLDAAQSAAGSVEENRRRAEEALREASAQAQEILSRANKAAAEVREQATADARTQADAIVEKARAEIERERAAAVAELRQQVVDLALLAAGRVIEAN
ncbi:MAG TPA: F0F1 ATP synthase subunit B, partial [Candidatus Dormibacteraeota bacterium]|nr:F0F1 ATP synthase subunit B [Candidatus Dormibacteraeota bacterium]